MTSVYQSRQLLMQGCFEIDADVDVDAGASWLRCAWSIEKALVAVAD